LEIMTQMLTHAPHSTIGKRYVLHEPLGRGGMGVVFRATDRLTGRAVALKRVSADAIELAFDNTTSSVDFRLTLAREFKLSASLRHPNIVKVLDYGFDAAQQPYFTMELLSDTRNILDESRHHPLKGKVELLVQMCYALAYLHRRGIIHRDLKPANVLVEDGKVKVLDFGLSAVHERSQSNQEELLDTTAGTLAYMPPETLMGESSGIAGDLYALGIIAYEMVAGRHPFHTEEPGTLINEIMFTSPDIASLDITVELASILEKLLRKDPTERYQNANEVVDKFRAALDIPEPAEITAIRESFLQAAALVGRNEEIRQLTESLEQALAGQGGAWLVAGENGVGKTRLLDELRRLAMVRGAVVMRGQAVRVGSRPYEMWLPIFRWLTLLHDEFTPEEIEVLRLFVEDLPTLLQRELNGATPNLRPQTIKARLRDLLKRVLRIQTNPMVLLLEDLQWAGSESLNLLRELAQFVADVPLLVVASYRNDEAPDLTDQLNGMPVLKLRRLSEEAISDLSAAMLGEGGRSQQVVELLRRETEGNVFFVVEVVRALAEEVGNLDQIGRMTLPQRVFAGGMKAVISRRLEQVDAHDRDLLQIAAIMGREIDLRLLWAVTSDDDLAGWLTRCASAAILEVEDDQWHFAHDKLREGLLEELSRGEREALHGRVAARLEEYYGTNVSAHVTALAYHYGQAGNLPKEVYYLTQAGEQALLSGAYHEAIEFLQRVEALLSRLKLSPEETQRQQIRLRQRRAEAHLGIGGYVTARALYENSLELCRALNDQNGVAATLGYLGNVALATQEFENARTLYEQSRALYQQLGDDAGVARALSSLGNVADEMGDEESARRLYQESLSLARQIGLDWGMAGSVRQHESSSTRDGQDATISQSKAQLEETLATHTAAQNAAGIAEALNNLGNLALAQADYDAAQRQFRQALQVNLNQYAQDALLMTLLGVAQLYIAQGEGRRALEVLAFLLHFPSSSDALQDDAEHLILDVEDSLPSSVVEEAYDAGKKLTLDTLVAQILG
jgi:eukaryotic-like serine/threonine-protein kinase